MTLHPITIRYEQSGDAIDERSDATLFAGGTDIIPLARTGVLDAPDLVDIKTSSLSTTIESDEEEWTIGALVTLAHLEHHEELRQAAPAIAQALSQVATLQIRNRATVGGNLLQRPRCSYFRDPDVMCWMKGGTDCPAIEGRNEHLALRGEHCVATQPSDLAAVLVALGAEVTIQPSGDQRPTRRIPVSEFLVAPQPEHRSLNSLRAGQVITSIHIPRTSLSDAISVYLKAMDRAVWQFALVGIAAVVTLDSEGSVEQASLCASGVANTPLSLDSAAESLVGMPLTAASINTAAALATEGLDALSENHYKLTLLRGLVARALQSATSQRTVD